MGILTPLPTMIGMFVDPKEIMHGRVRKTVRHYRNHSKNVVGTNTGLIHSVR